MHDPPRTALLRVLRLVPPGLVLTVAHVTDSRRLVRGYVRALREHPRHFVTKMRHGERFAGSTSDVIQRCVFVFGVWEPEITRWMEGFLRPGDTVVDVGANTGYFTLKASALVGHGQVVAVEPVPSIVRLLKLNLAMNDGGHVRVLNVVASDMTGQVEIFRAAAGNIGNSSTVAEAGHVSEGMVPADRLDNLLADLDTRRLRLVKIDTEGDEVRVVRGLARTLALMPSGAAVLVEVTPEKLALRHSNELDLWQCFPPESWIPHRVTNDYELDSYLARDPSPPVPISGPLGERADIIFFKR